MSHPVRAALALTVLALLPTPALAKKAPWVVMDDPGELYSTYQFSLQEEASLKKQLGEVVYAEVLLYGNEGGWPQGFNDLAERTSNVETLKQFHARQVATIDDKVLLKARAADNTHLPADWQPTKDIYIVIAAHAVRTVKKY